PLLVHLGAPHEDSPFGESRVHGTNVLVHPPGTVEFLQHSHRRLAPRDRLHSLPAQIPQDPALRIMFSEVRRNKRGHFRSQTLLKIIARRLKNLDPGDRFPALPALTDALAEPVWPPAS